MRYILVRDGMMIMRRMTMKNNEPLMLMSFVVLTLMYSVVHANLSRIDAQHCHEHGLAYGGTGLMMDGYCVQGVVRIPAFMIKGDK